MKRYSPTQLAVLRAIAASDYGVVEKKHLSALTGHRVTERTMSALERERALVRGLSGAWVMIDRCREQLHAEGVL